MGSLILPAHLQRPDKIVSLTMPRASLQALYDLIAHLEVGEYERKLKTWTDMTQPEIDEHGHWLDTLFQYLDDNGMRATKFKRVHADKVRQKVRHLVQKREGHA